MRHLATKLLATAALLLALPAPASAGLTEFDTCTQIVDYAQASLSDGSYPESVSSFDGSLDARSPYRDPSLPDPDEGNTVQDAYDDADDVVVSQESAPTSAGAAESDSSTTNTQEADVDEPDVVKNDGRRLYLFAGDRLRIYDGRKDVPVLLGERELDLADGTLLRWGSKLLAIGQKPRPRRARDPEEDDTSTSRGADSPQVVRVIELDISDPEQPRLLRTLDSPGRLITARQVGNTVRLVVNSEPDFDFYDYYTMDEDEREEFEEDLGLGDLVPSTTLRSAVTGARYKRPMAGCDDISHPSVASAGVELLSVLTVDLERGLIGIDRQGVLASPQVVYASAGTLYVGSARSTGWYYDDDYVDYEECLDNELDEQFCTDYEYPGERGLPPDTYTDVYAFDTTTPGQTTYVGSGRVRGLPINQYAFSEHQGDLRVATTTDPWWLHEDDEDGSRADNRVTVLRRNGGGGLGQIGLLTGVGKGEEIDAVRFFGERGYIATSRDTAPLSTLDLSDPTRPALLGTLRLSSVSAYLHPLGDDLLLGIGTEPRDEGQFRSAQVSLYDVSDPARPRRLAQRILGDGLASTGYDPHAFLWWPRKQMALVPFWGWGSYRYGAPRGEEADPAALVALRAKPGEGPNLTEIGRILHGPSWDHPTPNRAVVMGDRLFSISDLGIASNRVSDLAPLGYVPFLYGWAVPGIPGTTPPTTPAGTTPATTPVSSTPPTTPATTPAPSSPEPTSPTTN